MNKINEKFKESSKNKQNKQKSDAKNFKSQYFYYYDDIKSPTHKIVDW